MENRIKGEILIPILEPFPIEKYWLNLNNKVLDEILNLNSIPLSYTEEEEVSGLIDAEMPGRDYDTQLAKAQMSSDRKYSFIRITSIVSGEPMPYFNNDGTLKGHSQLANKAFLEDALSKRAADLVVIANLSSPGSISIGRPVIFINGKFCHTKQPMFADGIQFAVETAAKLQWPKLTKLGSRI